MKLRRLATACYAALMAVATLATSASAAEGYVEYPGGENPSPKPRVVDYVAGNAEWSHGDGIDITKGKYVYSEVFTSFYNHSSSCSLSGRSDSSGIVAPGVRSYSRVEGGYIWDTAYAYYWVDV